MSLFVIYGFDTASTLAEETRDPRRSAPKAVLFAVIGAFIIGGVFLLGTLMAIPNLHTAITNAWGPVQIIEANFSPHFATLYLLIVSAAIFVCCLSIMAATIRLCFGMSRDNQLPFSGPLSRVSPTLHTPVWTCITIAVVAAIPFLQYSGAATIAIAATGMIYLSYFLGNLVILRARTRGWPTASAPFRLGRWGIAINILGLLYGGAMLINFAWPRAASNPDAQPDRAARPARLPYRLPEQHPDPVDSGGSHRADRRRLLPGHRADQGIRADHGAHAGRPAAGYRDGSPGRKLTDVRQAPRCPPAAAVTHRRGAAAGELTGPGQLAAPGLRAC